MHVGLFPTSSATEPKARSVNARRWVGPLAPVGRVLEQRARHLCVGLDLPRVDLVSEMQPQGLLVDRLAGLGVPDQPADFGFFYPETDHGLDVAALLIGGDELLAHVNFTGHSFARVLGREVLDSALDNR
jgi:hypothetical protein